MNQNFDGPQQGLRSEAFFDFHSTSQIVEQTTPLCRVHPASIAIILSQTLAPLRRFDASLALLLHICFKGGQIFSQYLSLTLDEI